MRFPKQDTLNLTFCLLLPLCSMRSTLIEWFVYFIAFLLSFFANILSANEYLPSLTKIFAKIEKKAENMDGMSPTSSPKSVENNKERCNTNRNTKTCYIIGNENK